ncbi:ABC transporter ATP-binding protein [Pseudaminobacter sp. NGMCC 1.201702]|uniref:ABC transporter ATP-binding protein n=1 Tax=Pseudaminobacter sp. NGMCC 1.201702 TaxID=3391825 RepID=UPI0039EF2C0A
MIEVTNLHSGYGRIPILHGIDFEMKSGEVVGILGHNGMGKTTLLRTLVGQIKATGGRIDFAGEDITRASTAERSRAGIGYVPQGRDIFPQLSVLENMRMGEIMRAGSAIPEMLEHFPVLKDLLDRPGRGLSGGQQQILALARCLCGRPKLILLDEPTEGIQPSIVDLIAEKLGELKVTLGLGIILVEQDIRFIRQLADRVLIIQKGAFVAEISPQQLYDREAVDAHLGI